MKITKINLVGDVTTELPIAGLQPSNRYILKGSDGLGPVEQVVSIGKALDQGGIFQNRDVVNREVIVRIGLNPIWADGETPEDLRTEIYGLIQPSSYSDGRLRLNFFTLDPANPYVYTEGYVKKLEIVPFAKDPEVQITIACPSAYLTQTDAQFPDPGDPSAPSIENIGTAPTGFYFQIIFTADLSSWQLTSVLNGDFMHFDFDFLTDDILTVDTTPGKRSIKLNRGVELDVIGMLSADSTWLKLYKGVNDFFVTSSSFNWNDTGVYLIPQYWGI